MYLTKESILSATHDLFAKKGYSCSMAEIAKVVGIKVPSIYSHYKCKEDLITIVIQREVQKFFDEVTILSTTYEKISCKRKLKMLYDFVLNYFEDINRIRFWKNVYLIPNEALRLKSRESLMMQENQLSYISYAIFNEGVSKGEINPLNLDGSVNLFLCMIKGLLDVIILNSACKFDKKTYIKATWEAYWNGITKSP